MKQDAVGAVLQRLHVMTAEAESNQHLLERFVRDRDPRAFAAILERYGPMVLGIARRALRDEHGAEDVLQATFLVLSRAAATVRNAPSLAAWLHGVAVRLARRAGGDAARARRGHARPAPVASDPVAETSWREVRRVLDEELQRLPARYRVPLILCYLEGLTRDQAAARLGCAPGRLKGLLERGRERLRARLVRRGLAPGALATALLTDTVLAAPVPPLLVVSTLRAALQAGAGEPALACGAPETVARLTERGFRLMTPKKIALGLVLTLALGAGAAMLLHRADLWNPIDEPRELVSGSPDPDGAPVPPRTEPAPVPPADPLPPGAAVRFGTVRLQDGETEACFSPDGKWLATRGSGLAINVWEVATGARVETLPSRSGITSLRWRGDGKIAANVMLGEGSFLMVEFVPGTTAEPNGMARLEDRVRAAQQRTEAEIQARGRVTDSFLSPDGHSVVMVRRGARSEWTEVCRFAPGETSETVTAVTRVDQEINSNVWLSGDGKVLLSDVGGRILASDVTAEGKGKMIWSLRVPGDVHPRPIACFSARGEEIVIYFSDGRAELWNGPLGVRVRQFPTTPTLYHNKGEPGGVALSSNGARVALLHRQEDGTVGGRIVDVHTGRDLCALQPLPMPPLRFGIDFSPDGSRLARVGMGAVRVWDAGTGADACPLSGHRGGVLSLMVADPQTVVTTGWDFTVRAWDATSGAETWRTGMRELVSIAFVTSEGTAVVQNRSWGADSPGLCLDSASGKKRPLPGRLGEAKHTDLLAVSPDGKKVAALTRDPKNPTWGVWSWPAGDRLVEFPVRPPGQFTLSSCAQAHFSPDGRQLVAVVYYQNPAEHQAMRRAPLRPFLERWDLATGQLLDRLETSHWNAPQLVPCRTGLWLWNAGTEVRDALTGRLVVTLSPPPGEQIDAHRFSVVAISPDEALIAVGADSSWDKKARILIFDVGTGTLVRVLHPEDGVKGLRFLADGRLVSFAQVATVWHARGKNP